MPKTKTAKIIKGGERLPQIIALKREAEARKRPLALHEIRLLQLESDFVIAPKQWTVSAVTQWYERQERRCDEIRLLSLTDKLAGEPFYRQIQQMELTRIDAPRVVLMD